MNNSKIILNTFDKIKLFVNTAYRLDCGIKLISGVNVVNGKSILGIFSLDLNKPIEVKIINDTQEADYFPQELELFKIKQ